MRAEQPEWVLRFLRLTATQRQAILEIVLGRKVSGSWPPFWIGLYGEVRERGLVDQLRERVEAL